MYMKVNLKHILGIGSVFFAGLLLSSCEKSFDEKTTQDRNIGDQSGVVQVYIATVGAARNYVYVDGIPQNGSSLSAGSVFPSVGYGFVVPMGQRVFQVRDTLRTTTQVPISFDNVLEWGKNYTIFTFDTITAVKQRTVVTTITIPQDTSCRVRFAHFAYSTAAMPNVDVYSFKRMGNIFTNVSPTSIGNYIAFPSRLSDTLQVREAGTSTVLAQLNGFLGTDKRSYTLIYRGSHRVSTGRSLNSFVNY
jgi:hypothetical protein